MRCDLERKNKSLEKNNKDMNESLEKNIEVINNLKGKLKNLQKYPNQKILSNAVHSTGGISRFNIISEEYHRNFPKVCKKYTGFISYHEMNAFIKAGFNLDPSNLTLVTKSGK